MKCITAPHAARLHTARHGTRGHAALLAKLDDAALGQLLRDLHDKHDAHRSHTYTLGTNRTAEPVCANQRSLYAAAKLEWHLRTRTPNFATAAGRPHDEKITRGGIAALRHGLEDAASPAPRHVAKTYSTCPLLAQ